MRSPATDGRAAGLVLLSPSLNPHPEGSQAEADWDRAWRIATAQIIAERDAERRRRAGCLAAEPCTEIGT